MSETDWLATSFEGNRARLRAMAYRMLGSLSDADDALQESWLRLSRSGTTDVNDFDAWLTTVVSRVCLNVLRSRRSRPEDPVGVRVPDPVIGPANGGSPEDEALLADSVGFALQVVLETLTPAERLAFVLHDLFDLPFDEIGQIVGREPATARQLASRARRRLRTLGVRNPDPDVSRQRVMVDAFFAAAREGDIQGLIAVLDPDVVLRSDGGAARPDASVLVHGAQAVAEQVMSFHHPDALVIPAMVNGAAGVVITIGGVRVSVIGFTVSGSKIVEIDTVADPERLQRYDLSVLGGLET